nr:unnamed protein product [Callosobruchus analis]
MSSGKKLPQYLAAVCVSIGGLGTGSALAWTSNICEDLKEGKLNDLKMDDDQLGWAGSCMTLGAMIACIPMGFTCEWIGRKGAALVAAIPLLLGWIMVMFSNHEILVYAGRVLSGIGGGSFCVCGPLYTSEIAQPAIRGTLGAFFQLFFSMGILYSNVFGYAMPSLLLFNISCAAVPIVFAVCFVFQPESPVYYMRKGREDKAEKSLKWLRGKDYDASPELKAIQASIDQEKQMASFKVAIRTRAAKKAALICFMLMMYQQLCGINAITIYTQEIFKSAGSALAPHWCVIILGVVQVLSTLIATWAIERAGRKILLMASCGFTALASTMIGMFFTLKDRKVLDEGGVKSIGFLPIMGVNLFIIAFSMGLGPIPWMASSEIFPPEVKSKCSAAAVTLNWLSAFVVARFYLNLANAIGNDMTFFIFAGIAASGVFFTFFLIPETKGKTFEQIRLAPLNWLSAFVVARFYLNLANAIGNDMTFFIFSGIAASGVFFTFFLIPETKGKTFEQIVAELEGKHA